MSGHRDVALDLRQWSVDIARDGWPNHAHLMRRGADVIDTLGAATGDLPPALVAKALAWVAAEVGLFSPEAAIIELTYHEMDLLDAASFEVQP